MSLFFPTTIHFIPNAIQNKILTYRTQIYDKAVRAFGASLWNRLGKYMLPTKHAFRGTYCKYVTIKNWDEEKPNIGFHSVFRNSFHQTYKSTHIDY